MASPEPQDVIERSNLREFIGTYNQIIKSNPRTDSLLGVGAG